MLDLEVNGLMWGIFMSATRKAAVHLQPDYEQTLYSTKFTDFEQPITLSDISQRLNHGSEICRISTIEWYLALWRRSTLLHDRAIKPSKAKVQVYSDAVLCLGKMHEDLAAMEKCKEQIEWFFGSKRHEELCGTDAEPFEFERNICPGHTTMESLREIQMRMTINAEANQKSSKIGSSSCR